MASEREARRALDLHERELSTLPNVVGLGVRPDETGEGGYQVAVYVSRKLPAQDLAPDEVLPETLDVPSGDHAVAVPVTVVETGEFTFE